MKVKIGNKAKLWLSNLKEILSRSNPGRNGMFLVLIGPDGCGKTTIAEALLSSQMLKKKFDNIFYFHTNFPFLPSLIELLSVFGIVVKREQFANDENQSESYVERSFLENAFKTTEREQPHNKFRSMINPIYYGFNYLLGHLWILKQRRKGNYFIIFDRYFYEYMIQKAFLRCPKWLLKSILKIIPKPDIVVLLKNDPKIIIERKQEISIDEVARQLEVCEVLIRKYPNGFIVDTYSSPEITANNVKKIIESKLQTA